MYVKYICAYMWAVLWWLLFWGCICNTLHNVKIQYNYDGTVCESVFRFTNIYQRFLTSWWGLMSSDIIRKTIDMFRNALNCIKPLQNWLSFRKQSKLYTSDLCAVTFSFCHPIHDYCMYLRVECVHCCLRIPIINPQIVYDMLLYQFVCFVWKLSIFSKTSNR